MKKFLSVLMTGVCTVACAFGLAACGGGHTHEWSETWSSDATHHWHACSGCNEKSDLGEHVWNDGEITEQATAEHDGTKTFTCTVSGCGKTKTESVEYAPKYTVSAEEWTEIMVNITNYTANISIANEIIETTKLDDWKVIFTGPAEVYADIILTKEGDKYYEYNNELGSWKKKECDSDMSVLPYRELFQNFKNAFSSFTYSEETKEYSCNSLDVNLTCILLPLEITNVKAKFENNTIVSFTFEIDMDGTPAKYEYGSFGTTTVELPQVAE